MVNVCSVPLCNSTSAKCTSFGEKPVDQSRGAGDFQGEERITFHGFPLNNDNLLQKWTRAIPRDNWKPSTSSRLCSKHFRQDDFSVQSKDTNTWRKKSAQNQKRRLKPGVVPSLFPDLPSYYSCSSSNVRSTSATASKRLQRENDRLTLQISNFLASDKFSSIPELRNNMHSQVTFPKDVHFIDLGSSIMFLKFSGTEGCEAMKMYFYLRIESDLTFNMAICRKMKKYRKRHKPCWPFCQKAPVKSMESRIRIFFIT